MMRSTELNTQDDKHLQREILASSGISPSRYVRKHQQNIQINNLFIICSAVSVTVNKLKPRSL